MSKLDKGGDNLPLPEYLTMNQFVGFVQRFKEIKEIQDSKIIKLEEQVEYLTIKNRELENSYNLDVVQKARGNNKSRVHALYEYLQKDINRTCINTEESIQILGAELKCTANPKKIVRRVMIDLAKIYPDIEYFGGEKGRHDKPSYIKINRNYKG